MKNCKGEVKQFYDVLKSQMGIKRMYAVESYHCEESYGCIVEGEDWKVFYTGDTRPNLMQLKYAKDTTLLIHEATFEEELINDARAKFHSTFKEAIEVGKR